MYGGLESDWIELAWIGLAWLGLTCIKNELNRSGWRNGSCLGQEGFLHLVIWKGAKIGKELTKSESLGMKTIISA